MQPGRTLEQIYSEIDSVYKPQVDLYRQKQAGIPGQIQAEEQGLAAKQQTAFGDILSGARRRGTGVAFGGIPMQEQARYTADNYLPAVARLRQSGREEASSLEQAILGLNAQKMQQGQGIFENERNFAEQQRQFNAQMAAQQRAQAQARSQASRAMGTMGRLPGAGSGQATVAQRKDKGYDFKDPYGNPISAAAYAAATGTSFRQLLQTMANQGDAGARSALGFVGDDFGYDSGKIGNNAGLYNNLVWGTGLSANPNALRVGTTAPKSRLRVS